MTARRSISRVPSQLEKQINTGFRFGAYAFAWLTVLLVLYIVGTIAWEAMPAIRTRGASFLWGTTWDPNAGEFGILPHIWGTIYSSILALIVGTLFGLAVAIFLSERMMSSFLFWLLARFGLERRPLLGRLPDSLEHLLKNLVELLAAIPSVVYGLWGIFVVIPLIRPACNWLYAHLGGIPFFSTPFAGLGMLPAAIVLSIMILPTVTAISRDSLVAVPAKLREASYGLGATRWETIFRVLLPTASKGIFGAVILAFGRALGETMALAMLVGSANKITLSLFSPANTLAALLANNFPEAGPEDVTVLMYAALVLLAITLGVNIFGAWMLQRAVTGLEGTR